MNCPKHPDQKMTLLLVSYVCDICHPPRPIYEAKEQKEIISIKLTEEAKTILEDEYFGFDDDDMFIIPMYYDDYPGTD